jgi:hypothetical protein
MSKARELGIKYILNREDERIAQIVPNSGFDELVGLLKEWLALPEDSDPDVRTRQERRAALYPRLMREARYLVDDQGQRVAVEVDEADYSELLEAAEEMEDIHAADEAQNDWERAGKPTIPFDQFKRDLGLR